MEGHGALRQVEYPVRDGRPMGETDLHRQLLQNYAVDVLLDHFRDEPRVYVSGNNFIYYVQGDRKAVVSPDTYVVRGAEQRLRDTFKVWEEGGLKPCFVLEITSRSTRLEDLGPKMCRYRDDLEVPEYFLFDPCGEWIPERLRGFALTAPGVYQSIEPDAAGRLVSEQLGLALGAVGDRLRFFLPGADAPLPTRAERAEQERERAERERERAERERARAERERERAERERERGREEGREALLAVARVSLDPSAVAELERLDDLEQVRDRLARLLAGRSAD